MSECYFCYWLTWDDLDKGLLDVLLLLYTDRTEQQQYELILKLTSAVLSPFQQSMLKFALTLRMYSPTVQMFHQVLLALRYDTI